MGGREPVELVVKACRAASTYMSAASAAELLAERGYAAEAAAVAELVKDTKNKAGAMQAAVYLVQRARAGEAA